MYALIKNGAVVQYPYALETLKRANPGTSFPAQPSDDSMKGYDLYRVYFATQPTFDADTQTLQEETPVFDGAARRWTQVWSIRSLSNEELAQRTQQLVDSVVQQTQVRLDTFAQSRGYDSILSACTYATSSVAKFAAEGQYCVDARDATWNALLTMMAEVQAGTRPRPNGYEDVELNLPPLVWPT